MFRKYTLTTVILCSLAVTVMAQSGATEKVAKKSCSCGFSSINQFGILTGTNGNYPLLQTINGFRYKTWFVGAGVGLDVYHTTTIPLFLDFRKNLLAGKSTPFVYADGGIQFMTQKTRIKGPYLKEDYQTGAYYDVGIGYQVGLKNRHALLMSAGYSVKEIEYDRYAEVVCITSPCPKDKSNYKYKLNRLSLKVGYRF